jgi:hypothetical protein
MSKRTAAILMAIFSVMAIVTFFMEAFFLSWLAWGLIFGTMEWYALRTKVAGDTLSDQVWLGTKSKSFWWKVFWRVSIAVFLSWLMAHFLFGI